MRARPRGFHLVTSEVVSQLEALRDFKTGLAHIFILHTSASLTLNENATPDVLSDFRRFFDRLVPEDMEFFDHTIEGSDDMPAHIKASLTGSGLLIPISKGRFALGTWQGIYLCKHRNAGGPREIIVTLHGEVD
ncbi:MAG: secondary thiamine-phosphate synthase enzyme YjbQ [Rhodothermales bacterium]|nr:secondary thiamine-phosphate synthase enzyme YjbQ [Rhodothermales bacterium]